MHPDADKHFDLSRPITFLDSELEKIFLENGKKFDARSVDKLAMVHTHEGKEEWVLVHCEVQPEYKTNFPKRMFQYFSAKTASIEKGIKNQKERDSQLYKFKIQLVRELKEKNFEDKEVTQIMNFIHQYVKFESSEINSSFEKEILEILGRRELMGIEQQILEQAKEEGLQTGIKKGIQKGKQEEAESKNREFVMNLLSANKFKDEEIAAFAGVYLSYVQKVRAELENKSN